MNPMGYFDMSSARTEQWNGSTERVQGREAIQETVSATDQLNSDLLSYTDSSIRTLPICNIMYYSQQPASAN